MVCAAGAAESAQGEAMSRWYDEQAKSTVKPSSIPFGAHDAASCCCSPSSSRQLRLGPVSGLCCACSAGADVLRPLAPS